MASCAIGTAVCICSHLPTSGALFCAGSQVPSEELPSRLLHDLVKRADTRQSLHAYYSSGDLTVERPPRLRGWVAGRNPRGSGGIVASTEGSHVMFWPVTATGG